MNSKIYNIALIITSLFGFLEWGGDNKMFLFQVEAQLLSNVFIDAEYIMHPLVVFPLLGQAILLFTLFQRRVSMVLTFIGLICLSVLLLFMFLIGLITLNLKIFLSTLPFALTAFITVWHHIKRRAGT